jgi:hypothetical protein
MAIITVTGPVNAADFGVTLPGPEQLFVTTPRRVFDTGHD